MMPPTPPAAAALRCVARAAASSLGSVPVRKLAPAPVFGKNLKAAHLTRPFGSLSTEAMLCSGLSRLALGTKGNANSWQRPLSSVAPSESSHCPPGDPITFLTLSDLRDNPGAVKKGRRVGRGIGSSKGKTCGRGHKGQKARAGRGVHPSFEGGQTKFYKRLPKVGRMKNARFKLRLVPVNVGTVQDYVTMGRLVPERSDGVITMRDFVRAGIFPSSSIKSGVKLLGDGKERLRDSLLIEVPWASESAVEAVEARGGFVTTVHYNKLALRALLKPHKFPTKPESLIAGEAEAGGDSEPAAGGDVHDTHMLPRRARPPPKYMPYYTDYAKRGYLNPRVQLERRRRGLKDILTGY